MVVGGGEDSSEEHQRLCLRMIITSGVVADAAVRPTRSGRRDESAPWHSLACVRHIAEEWRRSPPWRRMKILAMGNHATPSPDVEMESAMALTLRSKRAAEASSKV